jgi:hypothetical protein
MTSRCLLGSHRTAESCAGESAQAVGDTPTHDLFLKAGNPSKTCAGESARAVQDGAMPRCLLG